MKRVALLLVAMGTLMFGITAAQEEGWIDLFNGKDLGGWEQKGGLALYTVEDAAIVGTSVPNTDNSFLCTKKHYQDFVLEFEFMGHPALNSGVQLRSHSIDTYRKGRVHGYQCELEDEAQERDWSCGIYDESRRGWLHPKKDDEAWCARFSEQGKRLWKNGEWNSVRIEARGNRIRTWLNGELRADLEDDETSKGFIGLQVHGVGNNEEPMAVRWRNIRLKELP